MEPKYKAIIEMESDVAESNKSQSYRFDHSPSINEALTVIESKIVTPNCSFSPDSGGNEKLNKVIEDRIMHGMIRLKP
ncbi:hypothetical protein QR98_0011240 [Sarcoptes scabiei]|uniref:Uncharacterized protein n=1 Tax=Sarcoptes scabiei TaxID=52283 RepID=A0A131ZV81_SARSC|nr:hypothetical protein QR98_0011240 [Sarcoptes scabiei]